LISILRCEQFARATTIEQSIPMELLISFMEEQQNQGAEFPSVNIPFYRGLITAEF
jgi:hypothetical protein